MSFLFARKDDVVDPNAIARDGSNSPSTDIPWNNFKITGLATPTANTDAATKKYVDDNSAASTGSSGAVQFADGAGAFLNDAGFNYNTTTGELTLADASAVNGGSLVFGTAGTLGKIFYNVPFGRTEFRTHTGEMVFTNKTGASSGTIIPLSAGTGSIGVATIPFGTMSSTFIHARRTLAFSNPISINLIANGTKIETNGTAYIRLSSDSATGDVDRIFEIKETGTKGTLVQIEWVGVNKAKLINGSGTAPAVPVRLSADWVPNQYDTITLMSNGAAAAGEWIEMSRKQASGAPAAGDSGSVQFSDGAGTFLADNGQLHWDETNNRLGVGTATPLSPLHVESTGFSNIRVQSGLNQSASIQLHSGPTATTTAGSDI